MLDLEKITTTTQRNCHISDARHAGNDTMCIFLLKMREYFRWEQRIPYTGKLPKEALGEWLVAREALWSEVEENDYQPLPLLTDTDPLDATAINQVLIPEGYIYSSGYGVFSKPHFFVGQLLRTESLDGSTLYVAGKELARDLVAPPAMSQNTGEQSNTIFIRQESVRRFLWERIEQWQWSGKKERAMNHAIDCYGGSDDMDSLIQTMSDNEINTMILHEIGEVRAGKDLGADGQSQWQHMVQQFSASRTEFLLRAARDIAADCTVTLPTLLNNENDAALHFYFANYSSMRKHLYPEMLEAYYHWLDHRSTDRLVELIKHGSDLWQSRIQQVVDTWKNEGQKDVEQITKADRLRMSRSLQKKQNPRHAKAA